MPNILNIDNLFKPEAEQFNKLFKPRRLMGQDLRQELLNILAPVRQTLFRHGWERWIEANINHGAKEWVMKETRLEARVQRVDKVKAEAKREVEAEVTAPPYNTMHEAVAKRFLDLCESGDKEARLLYARIMFEPTTQEKFNENHIH